MKAFLEFLSTYWDKITPWIVLREYQEAIVLRWGKFHRQIGPGGFHWYIPFREEVEQYDMCTDTAALAPQSLTTRDGVSCTVTAILTWKVHDLRKLLLKVQDKEQAMQDSAYGTITEAVSGARWEDISKKAFSKAVTKDVRKNAFKRGIEIEKVQFRDLTRARTVRILMDNTSSKHVSSEV